MTLAPSERKLVLTSLLYTIRRLLEVEEGMHSDSCMADDFIDVVWEHFPDEWPAMETVASTPEVGEAILRRGWQTGRPVVEMLMDRYKP